MTDEEQKASILQTIRDLLDKSSELSIAYVNQQRINDMRVLNDELAAQKKEIDVLASRLDKAGAVVSGLLRRVDALEIDKPAKTPIDTPG